MEEKFLVDDRYKAALSAIGLKDLQSAMRFTGGTPVGVHDDRNVMRFTVEIDGRRRELYIKRTLYHTKSYIATELRTGCWPQSRPIREYLIVRQLKALGMPVMKAIACGQSRRWLLPHEAFLIVEAVPARVSMYNAWRHQLDASTQLSMSHQRQVIRAAAKLVRQLHDADFRWPDLVSKHILLNLPTDDKPQQKWDLYLIDLERTYTSRSEKARQQDLLALLRSMPPNTVSHTDLLRFASAYCNCDQQSRNERRVSLSKHFAWAGDLYRRWSSLSHTGANGINLVRGRYISFRGITFDDRYIDIFRDHGFNNLKSVFKWQPQEIIEEASDKQSIIFELKSTQQERIRLRMRRYNRPSWAEQFHRILRCRPSRSSAWWQWRWARKLGDLGIATAPPVAFGDKMRGLLELRSFMLVRDLQGKPLSQYLSEPATNITGRSRHMIIRRCATSLARLHDAGLAFRDSPANHLLLTGENTSDLNAYWDDLIEVFRPRWRHHRWRIRNLQALAEATSSSPLTRTDQYRFIRTYLKAGKAHIRKRELIQLIDKKTTATRGHVAAARLLLC